MNMIRRHLARLRWSVRRAALNRHDGIEVAAGTFMAPTAHLQLNPDGFAVGGTIRLSGGVRLSDGVLIAPYGGSVLLEENVYVGPYTVLYGHGGLRIGRNTQVAAHCVIIPSNHCFDDTTTPIAQQGSTSLGIQIGQDVWIGCGVRVLDGVVIGDGCVIGAGAVVTRSLEPCSIATGVPARVVGSRKGPALIGRASCVPAL